MRSLGRVLVETVLTKVETMHGAVTLYDVLRKLFNTTKARLGEWICNQTGNCSG